MSWYTYIIECSDGKLYTGITNNIERRIKDHNSGNGCRFTKFRTPVKLLYNEKTLNKSLALKREAEIKRLTRSNKTIYLTKKLFIILLFTILGNNSDLQSCKGRKDKDV